MAKLYREKKPQKQISDAMRFTKGLLEENKKPSFRIKESRSTESLENMYQNVKNTGE